MNLSIRRTKPGMHEREMVFSPCLLKSYMKLLSPLHAVDDDQGELAFDMLFQNKGTGLLSARGVLGLCAAGGE